jgi:hypothetical protein
MGNLAQMVYFLLDLLLLADLPPGRYWLWTGMCEYRVVRNLAVEAVSSPGVTVAGNRILLGEVEVVGR